MIEVLFCKSENCTVNQQCERFVRYEQWRNLKFETEKIPDISYGRNINGCSYFVKHTGADRGQHIRFTW